MRRATATRSTLHWAPKVLHARCCRQIVSPQGWNDVAGLDYAKPAVRGHMVETLVYWMKTFHLDGFPLRRRHLHLNCLWEQLRPRPVWLTVQTITAQASLPLDHLANGFRAHLADETIEVTALRPDVVRVRSWQWATAPENASWAVLPKASTAPRWPPPKQTASERAPSISPPANVSR